MMQQTQTSPNTQNKSNREVKDSAFTAFFSEPQNAAKLYEALAPGIAADPDEINYTTLSGVLFLARKNDLAFTVRGRVLVISEHQSTINLNMPLRDAIYYGRTMEKLIPPRALYKKKLINIPTPQFYVFYNGNDNLPAETLLRLSDSYLDNSQDPMLELTVKVININLEENHPILKACQPLYEYSHFIQYIKDYLNNGKSRDEAILCAVKDCLEEGIMVNFLTEHGSEVVNMLYTQFNWDDALEVHGEEKYEEGLEKGKQTLLLEQINKKLAKGKSIETIAEELEETVEIIRQYL